jgi:L-asparaginase/Glu-tRNA(Gln) amidotransferase subunit D
LSRATPSHLGAGSSNLDASRIGSTARHVNLATCASLYRCWNAAPQSQEPPRISALRHHRRATANRHVAAGAKGLVIAGTGAGHTQNARKTLKELYDTVGVVVVRSARVGAGRVIKDDNWQEPGFVAADNLSPQKARILLQLALTKTNKPDEIQKMFDEY